MIIEFESVVGDYCMELKSNDVANRKQHSSQLAPLQIEAVIRPVYVLITCDTCVIVVNNVIDYYIMYNLNDQETYILLKLAIINRLFFTIDR